MSALVKHLGLADYVSTYEAMRLFTKGRNSATPDEIWVLEHPPVFTLGLAGDAGNLHSPSNQIPLVQVDRGGGNGDAGSAQHRRIRGITDIRLVPRGRLEHLNRDTSR